MKVHDAIMFHDELELLEIRLHELDDVVDRFLIVESTVTFRGKSKDLVFSQARDRFSSFLGRIDHLVVDDMPADGDAWARESHQRNATANGLAELGSEDIVMISDAHEIPARDAVARLCDVALPAGFIQPVHYGWLDFRAKTPNSHKNWVETRAMWAGSFTPQGLRHLRTDLPALIRPGGWHFSYVGGPSRVEAKLAAYSHEENDRQEIALEFHDALRGGKDPFGRKNFTYERIAVSLDNHPRYVVENQQRFKNLLLGGWIPGQGISGSEAGVSSMT